MKRTIKKQFWFSRDEAQDLQKKAKKNSTVKITAKTLDGTNRSKTVKIRIK